MAAAIPPGVNPFVPKNESLQAVHFNVARWLDDVLVGGAGAFNFYQRQKLDVVPSGEVLLNATPDEAKLIVLAAVEQSWHWSNERTRLLNGLSGGLESASPEIQFVWGRQQQSMAIPATLLRRKLPFNATDLLALLNWSSDLLAIYSYNHPSGAVVQAVQTFCKSAPLSLELSVAVRQFAQQLRHSRQKSDSLLATRIEQLCAEHAESPTEVIEETSIQYRPIIAAPAGHPAVLTQLKEHLEISAADRAVETERVGLDEFALRLDSPLREQHRTLSLFLEEVSETADYYQPDLRKLQHAKSILKASDKERGLFLLATAERAIAGQLAPPNLNHDLPHVQRTRAF